ncbi:hypothetical protein VE03_09429 [Pseudogymnoascus sp. 23342-1-I1]|nr:hypothetical protein VE03_09429 [Pseudogymnoascus sp. 23342-1-I1]
MSRRSSRRSAIASYAKTPDREIEKGVVEIDEEKETDPTTVNGKTEAAKPSKPTTAKRKGVHQDNDISPPPKRKIKGEEQDSSDEKTTAKPAKKPVKKRKTKEEAENDAMPVAARSAVAALKRKMYIGTHISAAGEKMVGGKKVGGEDRGIWAREIKLLEGMVGGEWGKEEKEEGERLQVEGKEERERCGGQVERKTQKTLDGMLKKGGRGKKKVEVEMDDENEGGFSH